MPCIRRKTRRGLYMLSGELGVSQVFLERWYIGGGYVVVSEVVVFYGCGKINYLYISILILYLEEVLLAQYI
jgi:hypothetical protein